ncbi:EAL domain-containing protein [Tropicimonas sp. TH_r6]|uniref:sensor domain-containing protein n=1 Tax=Tropicimonas sp. TH_r6 TaxID=3082085 RepID=UPI0029545D59|nr:EAL domain-containing protein [Tropicimonas sp. TH_r6]MDV7142636.1 EAL domain-containing protein [Tropicimonas sp. TH_r6]
MQDRLPVGRYAQAEDRTATSPFRSVPRLMALLPMIVLVLVLFRVAQFGLSPVRGLQLLVGLGLLVASLLPGHLQQAAWTPTVHAALLLLPVTGLVQFGLSAPAFTCFMAGSVMAAMFAGLRVAIGLLVFQLVVLLTIGLGFVLGWLHPVTPLDEMNGDLRNWLVLATGLVAVSIYIIWMTATLRGQTQQAIAAVRKRQEQLDALVRHAPEGIMIQNVETGCFELVNPRAEQILDMKNAALSGRKGLFDVSAPVQGDRPLSNAIVQALMQDAVDGGAPRFEWVLRDAAEIEIPCEINLAALPSETGSLVRISIADISDRTEAGRMRDLMTVLFQSSTEGMILCDGAGRIEAVNPAVERECRWTQTDLVGKDLGDLLADEDRPAIRAAIEEGSRSRLPGPPRWNGEVAFRRRDGTTYPTWTIVTAILDTASGRPTRFVVLARDLSFARQADEEIRRRSELDSLTGLPNRQSLLRRVANTMSAGTDTAAAGLALIFLDIDHLKQVNDRYGHAAGDAVLRELSRRLEDLVGEQDLLARHSGDEFALMLEGPDAAQRVEGVLHRLQQAVEQPVELDRGSAQIGLSMGVAFSPDHASDAAGLITAADQARFVAKAQGGNRSVLYTPEIGRRAHDRLHLLDELQKGLENGELLVLYQPVVELASGRLAKVEALVRWQHPQLGLLGPDRFVPLAEEAQMIDAVGDWVLRKCCADLPELRARFGAEFGVCVNVSPHQLARASEARMEEWRALIRKTTGGAAGLVLEITESALLDPAPTMVARLASLRTAGAQIALDDFGAGHTSLLYYLSHDFDFLKIDREFVRDVSENARAAALCESILGFSRRMGAISVAEGIESPEQARALRDAGCAFGQGYLFSQPTPLSELCQLPEKFHFD